MSLQSQLGFGTGRCPFQTKHTKVKKKESSFGLMALVLELEMSYSEDGSCKPATGEVICCSDNMTDVYQRHDDFLDSRLLI